MTTLPKLKIKAFGLLLLTLSFSSAFAETPPPVYLGVLENHYQERPPSPKFQDFVRMIFKKEGSQWLPMQDGCKDQECLKTSVMQYPPQQNWWIGLDGRSRGKLTTQRPEEFEGYSSIGRHEIVKNPSIPRLGRKTKEFLYPFPDDEPSFRPLITLSQPTFKDPQNWKPFRPSKKDVASAISAFRKLNPKAKQCIEGIPESSEWKYPDSAIEVKKSYHSNQGVRLIQLQLKGQDALGSVECVNFESQWFKLDRANEIDFLGKNLLLVDAGDYDSDGQSEVLFLFSEYNLAGYKLFYDGFKKVSTFQFRFH